MRRGRAVRLQVQCKAVSPKKILMMGERRCVWRVVLIRLL
jgi:hypothetical protein